jgi:hypothetical protein
LTRPGGTRNLFRQLPLEAILIRLSRPHAPTASHAAAKLSTLIGTFF